MDRCHVDTQDILFPFIPISIIDVEARGCVGRAYYDTLYAYANIILYGVLKINDHMASLILKK